MKRFNLPIRFEAIVYSKQSDDYRFLLIKRVPHDGGFWQPVTGTLESNESLEECMFRELQEEISISKDDIVRVDDMFYSFTWDKKGATISEFVFGVELQRSQPVILSEEHCSQMWCDFDRALLTLGTENNKKAFIKFADFKRII